MRVRGGWKLVAGGLVTSFLGLLYGSIMVGVPFQDPTPGQKAAEAFHDRMADRMLLGGLAVGALGVVMLVVGVLRRMLQNRAGKTHADT